MMSTLTFFRCPEHCVVHLLIDLDHIDNTRIDSHFHLICSLRVQDRFLCFTIEAVQRIILCNDSIFVRRYAFSPLVQLANTALRWLVHAVHILDCRVLHSISVEFWAYIALRWASLLLDYADCVLLIHQGQLHLHLLLSDLRLLPFKEHADKLSPVHLVKRLAFQCVIKSSRGPMSGIKWHRTDVSLFLDVPLSRCERCSHTLMATSVRIRALWILILGCSP